MWFEIFNDYTLRIVLLGTALLGAVSGIVGVFLTIRKQSLVGDTLSHATLPGIVLAFMITNQSSLLVSIIGAIIASIISLFLIEVIKRYSIVKNDAALAIILSSMFGLGQVLLSVIRDSAGQAQARLKKFVFGQAATMSRNDVFFQMAILIIVLLVVIIFWRHIKLYVFNKEFYQSLGYPGRIINIILNTLTILVVVSGIQSVGVILMSALLIAPSVAARMWSNRLLINIIISAFLGALAGALGTIFGMNISLGPVIVIFATSFVIISLLFARKTGIVWTKISEHIHSKQIRKYRTLIHIFENNQTTGIASETLLALSKAGYLSNDFELTSKGMEKVVAIMAGELK